MKFLFILSFLLTGTAWGQFNIGNVSIEEIAESGVPPETVELVKSLWKTRVINNLDVYRGLNLSERGRGLMFATYSPYSPPYIEKYQTLDNLKYPLPENPISYIHRKRIKRIKYYSEEVVVAWEADPNKYAAVCALQFTDSLKQSYLLKTFESKAAALNAGFIVTHFGQCGMCSSLKDLAVYLAKPDLTTPARKCSKKLDVRNTKSCYKNKIGFSGYCSEQWAYNSENTRNKCGNTCIQYYGFLNVMRDTMDRPNTDDDGNLNVCLACDEYKSGPGFKYGAGRTRRNSGITSAINRDNDEVFDVDHFLYFE